MSTIVRVSFDEKGMKVQSKWENASVEELSEVVAQIELLKLKLLKEIDKLGTIPKNQTKR